MQDVVWDALKYLQHEEQQDRITMADMNNLFQNHPKFVARIDEYKAIKYTHVLDRVKKTNQRLRERLMSFSDA